MNLKALMEAADAIKAVVTKIRNNRDYQLLAVQKGSIAPKLGAIPVVFGENWEALSKDFSELQDEVNDATALLAKMVFAMKNEENTLVSNDAIRILSAIGVEVVIDVVLEDNENGPLIAYGVFEVQKNLKFAI